MSDSAHRHGLLDRQPDLPGAPPVTPPPTPRPPSTRPRSRTCNAPARDLVGDQACVNCHGDQVFRERESNGEWHHGANPYGVEACVVCHTRYGSISRSMGGDRLTAYVHGVHNSHAMPARDITATLDPRSAARCTPVHGHQARRRLRAQRLAPHRHHANPPCRDLLALVGRVPRLPDQLLDLPRHRGPPRPPSWPSRSAPRPASPATTTGTASRRSTDRQRQVQRQAHCEPELADDRRRPPRHRRCRLPARRTANACATCHSAAGSGAFATVGDYPHRPHHRAQRRRLQGRGPVDLGG